MTIPPPLQALSNAVSLFHSNRTRTNQLLLRTFGSGTTPDTARALERVSTLPKFSKDCGERLAAQAENVLNLGAIGPQKGILRHFRGKCYGGCDISITKQHFCVGDALLQCGIAWLDRQREARIR